MKNDLVDPKPKIVWHNIFFFASTGLIAVIGAPLYISRFGVPVFELWLTVFYIVITSISITAGYHRLYSHSAYLAHPVVQCLLLFFGAAAFEQSELKWSSQHRDHHQFTAKRGDPYSIGEGFFYAHIGWVLFWAHTLRFKNVKDLKTNRFVMLQHRYYLFWALVSGIILPFAIGLWYGNLLAAFIFPVCARLAFVHHATFCVNSVCHLFGGEPYDLHSTARNNWMVALVTNGEGFHNYHHRFPSDYRNGIRWYQWDPTKWLIRSLAALHMAWNLKEASKFRILEARLLVHQELLRRRESRRKKPIRLERFFSDFEGGYQVLRSRLFIWEKNTKEYRQMLHGPGREPSKAIRQRARKTMNISKQRFKHTYQRRERYLKSNRQPTADAKTNLQQSRS